MIIQNVGKIHTPIKLKKIQKFLMFINRYKNNQNIKKKKNVENAKMNV